MIDRATVQKIKDTANIVEVVGDYVHLIKTGANYKGLCPFHNERTPSFSVNPSKNFCYCFSCHKGGSPINFIMEKEGITYREALLQLAKKYGIKVEEREESSEEQQERSEREAMMVANEWAMKKMENDLFNTPDGRNIGLQYIYGRGVTEEAARKFHLGYALDHPGSMLESAKKAGLDIELMVKLGILGKSSKDGSLYDRFRGRVIFPIFNDSGKVVAFGGRDLKGAKAKYVNSPESPVYKKSRELYGLFQAKSAISKYDKCFLVEGYMDVIGMWQSGMENVISSSGTALTEGQIALIRRFTKNLTLIYDGDAAGIKASLRGIDMLLSQDMKIKVLLLPDGHDPDSFARAHTPEEFREYVKAHETDFIRFKIDVLLSEVRDDPTKRIEVVKSVVDSIAHIQDKISRFIYIRECSQLLDMSEDLIKDEVEKRRGAIVAEMRRERDRAYIAALDAQKDAGAPGHSSFSPIAGPDYISHTPGHKAAQSPTSPSEGDALIPIERRLCEIVVRFGLLDFCEEEHDDDTLPTETEQHDDAPAMINVAEFIASELEVDDIKLSHPVYAGIFDRVLAMRDDLAKALPAWSRRMEQRLDRMRKEGYEEIARASLPLNEIQVRERILEDRLQYLRDSEWRVYVKQFPGMELASCPDAEIRTAVTDLIAEPYELSKIFFRDRTPEKEEDRLDLIVPRAILELKDTILGIKTKKLMNEFRSMMTNSTRERLEEKQREIAALLSLRSRLAKNIGERIICPK